MPSAWCSYKTGILLQAGGLTQFGVFTSQCEGLVVWLLNSDSNQTDL